MFFRNLTNLSLAVAALAVAGCGGGSNSTPISTSTLTGSAVKGPVGNATVNAKKPDGTACGTTTTNLTGQYSFTTACTGDVIVEVAGGTYTDEATNTIKTLDTPLKAVITASGGTVDGVITPLTTMAFSYAFTSNSTATKAAFDAQAAKVATQFGLTGVNIATDLPVVSGSTNAYGKALKGVSQYLKDNPAKNLASVTTASLKSLTDFAAFGALFTTAYNNANGSNVIFNFDGAAFNVTGTGSGGVTSTSNYQLSKMVTSSTIPPTVFVKNSTGQVTDSIFCGIGTNNSTRTVQLTFDATSGTAILQAPSDRILGSYNAITGLVSFSDVKPATQVLVGSNGTIFYSESNFKFNGTLNAVTGTLTGTYSELSATTWSLDTTRQVCMASGNITATKL